MPENSVQIYYTDDDQDDLEIFTDAVNEISNTLQIVTLRNGDELLKLLKTPPLIPFIIFLDLNMPVKNGYEVLKEIKLSAVTRNIPVVILSTGEDPTAINLTKQLGARLYIPKPSSFISLKKAIQYSLSIDWETFAPLDKEFVFRPN
jgi:response regulator RpfG family c-di-GMP phosphodiesterase